MNLLFRCAALSCFLASGCDGPAQPDLDSNKGASAAEVPSKLSLKEGEVELFRTAGLEAGVFVQTAWVALEDQLQRTSRWPNTAQPPQLSVVDAVDKARHHLRSQGRPDSLRIQSVMLKNPNHPKAEGDFYFYVISFHEQQGHSEDSNVLDVVVLLDGSIVPARKSEE